MSATTVIELENAVVPCADLALDGNVCIDISNPVSPPIVLTVTWETVRDDFASWQDVFDTFPTWADLILS